MHRFVLTVAVTVVLGVAMSTPALAAGSVTPTTHYRWTDTAGVVHFGDTIPASALAGGYDIVDDQGRVVRHVDRELTPAERRAAQAAAARAAADQREEQRRRTEDAQMLAAYPTDKDLQQSQQAQLKQIELDISSLESNLRSQEDSLTELLTHAADLEHSGKPVPADLNGRIADQRKIVNGERADLAQRRADLSNSQARFTEQLARYRALRAKSSSSDDPPQL